jgi:fumarate reductase subunit D
MKLCVKGLIEGHPITFAFLQFTPFLPFGLQPDKKLSIKLVCASRTRLILCKVVYLLVMAGNISMCHRVFSMYADKKFSTSQGRAMFSLLLCHILGLCTYATKLFTDLTSLINKSAVDFFKVCSFFVSLFIL